MRLVDFLLRFSEDCPDRQLNEDDVAKDDNAHYESGVSVCDGDCGVCGGVYAGHHPRRAAAAERRPYSLDGNAIPCSTHELR
jgi:hypothetical protein